MTENQIILLILAIQYLLLATVLKFRSWPTGWRLFVDALVFQVVAVGTIFCVVHSLNYIAGPGRSVTMRVASITYFIYGAGTAALWAIRRVRGESLLTNRTWFTGLLATIVFMAPLVTAIAIAAFLEEERDHCSA